MLLCLVVPTTLICCAAFASAAFAGNFFATGHDLDFHCTLGDDTGNAPSPDECGYYHLAAQFVRNGSNLPILILDRDNSGDGANGSNGDAAAPLESVTSLNYAYSNLASATATPSSPPYVVEDPQAVQPTIINGTPPPGVSASSTWPTTPLVDSGGHPLWSAIIVASDENCGGCDLNDDANATHPDSDAINARTGDIQAFFNAGGGLLYQAGATDAYDADGVSGKDVYYASVPVPVGGQPVQPPFTVTPAGQLLGVTDTMANCCATHNSFSLPASGSPIQVAETDSSGLAETLFVQSGAVCSNGFCSPLATSKTADSSTVSAGGTDGYTITISNPNQSPATVTSITDTLASGFTYVPGSTSGVTGADPSISGQTFTWNGSFSVPAAGAISLHFNVTAPQTPGGPFYDNAGGAAAGGSVTPTGNAAPVTVTSGSQSGSKPSISTSTPTGIPFGGEVFAGMVNPNGCSGTAHFEIGIDPAYIDANNATLSYDQSTAFVPFGSGTSRVQVTGTISGLVPNAIYHVRLVATNCAGTTIGPDLAFTTAKDPAPGKPTLGKSANLVAVSGVVFVRGPRGRSLAGQFRIKANALLNKGQGFIPLTEARQVPTGSQVDSRRGTVKLTTATAHVGRTQTGTFFGGLWSVTQARRGFHKGLTTLKLLENLFSGGPSFAKCGKAKKASASAAGGPFASAALSSRILQTLHARERRGRWRSRGRYSAATVRGTDWTMEDRCNGTWTHVRRGTVTVRDFRRRKTITLHAGQTYLARAILRRHH